MKVKKHYRKSGYFDRKFRPAPNFNRIRSKITAVKNIIFDHFLIEYKTGRTSSDEYYPPVFSRSWTRSKIKSRPKYLCGGKFPAIRNLEFFTGSGRKYMFVSSRKYIFDQKTDHSEGDYDLDAYLFLFRLGSSTGGECVCEFKILYFWLMGWQTSE